MLTADLSNKVIAITGASSGFGHHFAGLLARAGGRVVLGARRTQKLEARVSEIKAAGGEALAAPLDVRDPSSIVGFFEAAEAAYGPVDVLINNAGIEAGAKTYMMIDEADWDDVLDTNLKSVWLMSRAFTERVAHHKVEGGNIVNISSLTDVRSIKGQFPYAVSKAGVSRMTELLALEGARFGIRVNALAPGYILTALSAQIVESEAAPTFQKGIPLRRFGELEDLDGPLMLLVSDASTYMTGAILRVDGGHSVQSLTM